MPEPAGPEDVTASWLESRLRDDAGFRAARVRAVRTERIGVGYGLAGTTVRVHVDGGGGAPPTVVLKWADAAQVTREAEALRAVAPHLGDSVPRLLGVVPDVGGGRGLLVLADVGDARQGDCVAGIDAADTGAVLAVAARLHRAFANGSPVPAALPRRPSAASAPDRLAAALPLFLALHGDGLSPAMRALAERLPALLPSAVSVLTSAPATLVHGDLHADNVVFREGGAPVVLDWAEASVGPAALDVGHLLIDGVLPQTRRASEDALIDGYLAAAQRRDAGAFRREVAHALVVGYGGVIRWTARMRELAEEHPRGAELRRSILRNLSAAFEETWAPRL